ncbi:hypothetical protein C7999DRAFT_16604, partial [Corynascus novoguineensis]
IDDLDPVRPGADRSGAQANTICRCYGTSSKTFGHLAIISTIGVELAPTVIGAPLFASLNNCRSSGRGSFAPDCVRRRHTLSY